jgi:hypothetical protein
MGCMVRQMISVVSYSITYLNDHCDQPSFQICKPIKVNKVWVIRIYNGLYPFPSRYSQCPP